MMDADVLVSVILPIPPKTLSKNGGMGWSKRVTTYRHGKPRVVIVSERGKDYKRCREDAARVIGSAINARGFELARQLPFADPVRLDITWRYSRGRPQDDDNAIARCAAYRDGAQDAGLVVDDRTITSGAVTFERVERGAEEIQLTFRDVAYADAEPLAVRS